MAINKEQIEHLARLARLHISANEEKQLVTEVAAILDFVSKLQEVGTQDVLPAFSARQEKMTTRPDAVEDCDNQAIKKGFPETKDGLLQTPKIFS